MTTLTFIATFSSLACTIVAVAKLRQVVIMFGNVRVRTRVTFSTVVIVVPLLASLTIFTTLVRITDCACQPSTMSFRVHVLLCTAVGETRATCWLFAAVIIRASIFGVNISN
jgi:hypothetical protein